MAPLAKVEHVNPEDARDTAVTRAARRKYELVHSNLVKYSVLHLFAAYGAYLMITEAQWKTSILYLFLVYVGGFGITAGAHRLWAHRSLKVKLPFEILLMLMNSMAFQSTAIDWIRDHRLHHKYSDTDADPYNASRGFFFSHIGWLLVRKHPEVKRRGKTLDMSDINNNPVLRFQQKYAIPVIGMCCYVIPTLIPVYLWNESLRTAWFCNVLRHVVSLHFAFSVNSVAHLWGNKPYDRSIKPVQSILVSLVSGGEGYHNYHHVFPWDYRTSEVGNNWINTTTVILDVFARLGLAYDLKTASDDVVSARIQRTGDGTDMWGMVGRSKASE